MNAVTMGHLSLPNQMHEHRKTHTGKKPIPTQDVGRSSPKDQISLYTRRLRLHKELMFKLNVERPSLKSFDYISENSYWWKTLWMQWPWENLYPEVTPHCTPECSYWKKTLCVYWMWNTLKSLMTTLTTSHSSLMLSYGSLWTSLTSPFLKSSSGKSQKGGCSILNFHPLPYLCVLEDNFSVMLPCHILRVPLCHDKYHRSLYLDPNTPPTPTPGIFLDQESNLCPLCPPCWQVDSYPLCHLWSP